MRSLSLLILILSLAVAAAQAVPPAAPAPQKMRPYAGIGVLELQSVPEDAREPLQLYEEPGLSRIGSLEFERIPQYDWIFGSASGPLPLLVTARKGEWLRVAYDDAGREAWINPGRTGLFQSWETYMKARVCSLLPGLQKRFYQTYQQPGRTALAVPAPRQSFKVLRLENDWAMVLSDVNTLVWLRWRDDDGRLLVGMIPVAQAVQP